MAITGAASVPRSSVIGRSPSTSVATEVFAVVAIGASNVSGLAIGGAVTIAEATTEGTTVCTSGADGIARIARGQAETFGAPEPEIIVESDYTPATYNDPELTARVMGVIAREIGEENVVQNTPVMGGEDFSQYGRTNEDIPSLIYWLGAVDPETYAEAQDSALSLPSLHSPFFVPDAETTIETGVTVMTAAAIDLLQPE